MQFDASVIRFRFLIAGFILMFFSIGAVRFAYFQYINFTQNRPHTLKDNFPPGSMADQVQQAQRRLSR